MFNTDTLLDLASIRPDAMAYFIGRLAVTAQSDPAVMQAMTAALADTQDYISG